MELVREIRELSHLIISITERLVKWHYSCHRPIRLSLIDTLHYPTGSSCSQFLTISIKLILHSERNFLLQFLGYTLVAWAVEETGKGWFGGYGLQWGWKMGIGDHRWSLDKWYCRDLSGGHWDCEIEHFVSALFGNHLDIL